MALLRNVGRALGVAAATLTLASCAELQIYSDASLTMRTGIPFYVSKPYLLVSRTGAKDKPIDVQVIYMPDLTRTYYARIMPGFGSSETSLGFTNSILATVGQKSDTQLDELITAYGGLQTALAGADRTRRETELLGDEAAPDYAAVAAQLTTIATQIEEAVQQARTTGILTPAELDVLTAAARVSRAAATSLASPATAESQLQLTVLSLKNSVKTWDDEVGPASGATAGPELITRRNLAALRAQLGRAIATLSPVEAPAAFTLYEIVMSTSGTRLVEVGP